MTVSDDSIMITGRDNIEHARWLTVRSMLGLEIRTGMTRHGRPARILANEITGRSDKTKRAAYNALNAHIVTILGSGFDRPFREAIR